MSDILYNAAFEYKKLEKTVYKIIERKETKHMELKKRVKSFLDDTGATVMTFCKKINISNSYYYRWVHGEVEFSKDICDRI